MNNITLFIIGRFTVATILIIGSIYMALNNFHYWGWFLFAGTLIAGLGMSIGERTKQ